MADAIVYGSLYAMMSIGLTLTYMTTKVPNFAQGSFVTVGVYLAFSLYHFEGLTPYYSVPASFVIGGMVAVLMYLFVLKPLAARGASLVSVMIATLAVDIAFIGIFGIYSDLLSNIYQVYDSKYFLISSADFYFLNIRGLTLVAPLSLAIITISLWILLTRTRFGIAMRAAVENPNLAGVLGSPHIGSDFIVGIFAASILGGLTSVYGAVIGGLIVGCGEILLTVYGSRLFGSWVTQWQPGIPMLILAVTLLFVPQGITSVKVTRPQKLRRQTA